MTSKLLLLAIFQISIAGFQKNIVQNQFKLTLKTHTFFFAVDWYRSNLEEFEELVALEKNTKVSLNNIAYEIERLDTLVDELKTPKKKSTTKKTIKK